jgi:hypothetical protein
LRGSRPESLTPSLANKALFHFINSGEADSRSD